MDLEEIQIFSVLDGPDDKDKDEPQTPNAPGGLENDDKDPDEN